MKVIPSIDFRHLPQQTPEARSITIGNFDGAHLGHQSLMEQAKDQARRHGCSSLAMTFSPRPESFFKKAPEEKLLFTEEQKLRSFAELGMDHALIQKFDELFCQMSPEDFYDKFLSKNLGAKAISIGHDFRFGKGRQGNTGWLKKRGEQDGTHICQCDAVSYKGQPISSTRIREALKLKDIDAVKDMLGRPYLLEGHIQQGDQIGRRIGVPTLNLENHQQLLPGHGVYAGYVWLARSEDQPHPSIHKVSHGSIPAIINCGVRPTFKEKGSSLRVEAHLLSGDHTKQDYYELKAGFYFTHFIRDELKFDSSLQLTEQINKDIKTAKNFLEIP